MAEKWDVEEVQEIQVGETPCWQVAMIRPDGNRVLHLMPRAVFDVRAAEYGVDPTDTDTLLTLVLHEPFMPMVDDPVTGPRYEDDGVILKNASSTSQALQAHLARVNKANVSLEVKNNKALDTIRRGYTPNQARIQRVREQVDVLRWIHQYGSLPTTSAPEKASAAEKLGNALGIKVNIPKLSRE
jgi:hypothetical protein